MHPDTMIELANYHREELHKEATRYRLAKGRSRTSAVPRASGLWPRLGFGKLRSKTA